MKKLFLIAATILLGCEDFGERPSPVPDGSACEGSRRLQAWAAPERDDATATVFGTVEAEDGVTVRAVYVAGQWVPRTDFNFRSWSVSVTAARLHSLARHGRA